MPTGCSPRERGGIFLSHTPPFSPLPHRSSGQDNRVERRRAKLHLNWEVSLAPPPHSEKQTQWGPLSRGRTPPPSHPSPPYLQFQRPTLGTRALSSRCASTATRCVRRGGWFAPRLGHRSILGYAYHWGWTRYVLLFRDQGSWRQHGDEKKERWLGSN